MLYYDARHTQPVVYFAPGAAYIVHRLSGKVTGDTGQQDASGIEYDYNCSLSMHVILINACKLIKKIGIIGTNTQIKLVY